MFRRVKESEDEETGRLLLYSDVIGNRLIEVHDPNFSYSEMEQARVALLSRLQELEQPEEAGADKEATARDDQQTEREAVTDTNEEAAEDKIVQ